MEMLILMSALAGIIAISVKIFLLKGRSSTLKIAKVLAVASFFPALAAMDYYTYILCRPVVWDSWYFYRGLPYIFSNLIRQIMLLLLAGLPAFLAGAMVVNLAVPPFAPKGQKVYPFSSFLHGPHGGGAS